MKRTIALVAVLVVVAIGVGIGLHVWSGPGLHGVESRASAAGPVAVAPLRVAAAAPVRKTLRRESIQPGQIEAFEITPLFAKLPSYVQKLNVDIGDRVDPKQPLVELFLTELKDEIRQ